MEQKKERKNLANCSGVDFLRQSNRIRKFVQKWLKDTKVLEIRKRQPILEEVTDKMTEAEGLAVMARNDKRIEEQTQQNISDMLDAALEEKAEETLVLLGMLCFIEPEDLGNVKPTELLANFAEMMADPDVLSFFTSLTRLDVMNISK